MEEGARIIVLRARFMGDCARDEGTMLAVGLDEDEARALIARPRVLILDEATANLDYATEKEIRKVLFAAGNHPTTLVIAHRYSMVEMADHVIVIDAGRIIDQGTVPELIARGGWFAGFAAGRRIATPHGNGIEANA